MVCGMGKPRQALSTQVRWGKGPEIQIQQPLGLLGSGLGLTLWVLTYNPPFWGGAGVGPTGGFAPSEATGGCQRPEEDKVLGTGPSFHLLGKAPAWVGRWAIPPVSRTPVPRPTLSQPPGICSQGPTGETSGSWFTVSVTPGKSLSLSEC